MVISNVLCFGRYTETVLPDQVKEFDKFLKKLMKNHELIYTIPGISVTLGSAILGEIGDVKRFGPPSSSRPLPEWTRR